MKTKCSEKQRKGLEEALCDCLGFEVTVLDAWREDGNLYVNMFYVSDANRKKLVDSGSS